MVRLNTKDTAVLARVAQYDKLSGPHREELVQSLTGDARNVGLVILGRGPNRPQRDVLKAARRIQQWAMKNRSRARYKFDKAPVVAAIG